MTHSSLTRSRYLKRNAGILCQKLLPNNPLIGWAGHYGLLSAYFPLWGVFIVSNTDRWKVVQDEEDHCASKDIFMMYIPMISHYRLMSALLSGTASNV